MVQEELFDLAVGCECDGGGEQRFALAKVPGKDEFVDQPQVESCLVAEELCVVRRFAVEECDREAEFVCIEVAGTLDVGDRELWLDGTEDEAWRRDGIVGHDNCA